MGDLGGEEVELYQELLRKLQEEETLDSGGVKYNPYEDLAVSGELLALVKEGKIISSAKPEDKIQVILPATTFYMESGGQVSDTGRILGEDWIIQVEDIYPFPCPRIPGRSW